MLYSHHTTYVSAYKTYLNIFHDFNATIFNVKRPRICLRQEHFINVNIYTKLSMIIHMPANSVLSRPTSKIKFNFKRHHKQKINKLTFCLWHEHGAQCTEYKTDNQCFIHGELLQVESKVGLTRALNFLLLYTGRK